MGFNLCIDQGNSRTKIAVFNPEGEIMDCWLYRSQEFRANDIDKFFAAYPQIESSIISSVINIEPAIVNTLNKKSKKFVLFDHNTPVPIEKHYAPTLGQDRLAAAVGASQLYPDSNLLVIDSGTAITYDFVSAEKGFMGGNIAPGLKMRLKALRYFTGKLPKVETTQKQIVPLFADNTKDAMIAGAVNGICFEIEGYIKELSQKVDDLKVIITGGNATTYHHKLNSDTIFQKNLVLLGLNTILNYNKNS